MVDTFLSSAGASHVPSGSFSRSVNFGWPVSDEECAAAIAMAALTLAITMLSGHGTPAAALIPPTVADASPALPVAT